MECQVNAPIQQEPTEVMYEQQYAREMVTKQGKYIWFTDNSCQYIQKYNIYELQEHPDGVRPLNVYGYSMLNDYIQLNHIDMSKYSHMAPDDFM